MKKQVRLYELGVFQGIFPLVSGYLEASAKADLLLDSCYGFSKQSFGISQPGIEDMILEKSADVFTMSCYVWNIGIIRRLIPKLQNKYPNSYIILGGPQVMKRAKDYLDPKSEKVIICNGEGEKVFPNILRQLNKDEPDLEQVYGISFYKDEELITTPQEDRIKNLEEIPSPFLNGYMDSSKSIYAVLETNRGCPFKCTYCYWGAATNAKVHKYSDSRIFDEITWCSNNRVMYVFIADANFGMLKRDVDIAKHLAACKKKTGYPQSVYFSSSKNTPDRVSEIAKILADAGLVSTQPISLQTMSPEVLGAVKRENIKRESYDQLQKVLNERNISSFIEMIWPLPGETLDSFKSGIDQLCRSGADSMQVYPLMIINNVEMEQQIDEYKLVTIDDPDPNSEAKIVVETRDVTNSEYLDGIRFTYHSTSLYCQRSLWYVSKYLVEELGLSYDEIFSKFSDFCKDNPSHPYASYIERTISESGQYKFSATGGIVHLILHEKRVEFSQFLVEFVKAMGWYDNDEIRICLDIDLLVRPYIYSNTQLNYSSLSLISEVSANNRTLTVNVPFVHRKTVSRVLDLPELENGLLEFNYQNDQLPYMSGKPIEDNYQYCNDRCHKMQSLLPDIQVARFIEKRQPDLVA